MCWATCSSASPPQQTITELSEALLASRSAITGAVALLAAIASCAGPGQWDSAWITSPSTRGHSIPPASRGATYQEQAALAREALGLLDDGLTERRSILEEAAAFYDFLAERMPALLTEWHALRDKLAHNR